MEQPTPAPCDPGVIEAFLDTLAAARREDEVGRGNLAKYGLEMPTAAVEIDAAGTTHKLALGNINPLQTLVYVLVGDSKTVLLTTSSLLTYSLTNSFGWRDKRMTDIDPAQVQRLVFRTLQNGTLAVRRGPAGLWVTEGEVPWRVDPTRLTRVLQDFARLRAVGVAAENKASLGGFGLDNRRFGVQVETAAGQVAGDIVFGFNDGKGANFGIVPNKPEVFRVDAELLDTMLSLVTDPRDKRALPPFLPEKITRLRVRSPDDVFTLRRISSQDWRVEASQRVDSTYALSPGAVDALLSDLAVLEIGGFPAQQPARPAYEPASIALTLEADGRPVSGLEIGKKDPRGLFSFARGPGEPAVFLVSPAVLLNIPFDLERLKADTSVPAGN
jgi:hypothetical protein